MNQKGRLNGGVKAILLTIGAIVGGIFAVYFMNADTDELKHITSNSSEKEIQKLIEQADKSFFIPGKFEEAVHAYQQIRKKYGKKILDDNQEYDSFAELLDHKIALSICFQKHIITDYKDKKSQWDAVQTAFTKHDQAALARVLPCGTYWNEDEIDFTETTNPFSLASDLLDYMDEDEVPVFKVQSNNSLRITFASEDIIEFRFDGFKGRRNLWVHHEI